ESYAQALKIARQLAAEFPQPQNDLLLADLHFSLGQMLARSSALPEAEASHRRALAIVEKLVRHSPTVAEYQMKYAAILGELGYGIWIDGRPEEGELLLRRTLAVTQKLAGDFPTEARYQSELGGTLSNLARLVFTRGDLSEAQRLVEQAIQHQRTA